MLLLNWLKAKSASNMNETNGNGFQKLLVLALTAIIAIGGVTFKLVIERMDKQETIAAADISALREEIKTTKSDAKDAVSAAAVASKDAVAATASALKDAVAATAAASKDSVAATASALKDAVTATAVSSKDAVAATASALSEKIELLNKRVEKLEDRSFHESKNNLK